MERFIKNRKNQRILVVFTVSDDQKGLAFIMHGLSGHKEQGHILAFEKAFLSNNYSVVKFDTTNTFGESDGKYEDATATNYINDLEDVIKWSQKQKWFQVPFVLVGHSLGGLAAAYYAENNPNRVKALAPVATVVSGQLYLTSYSKADLKSWEETGFYSKKSKSRPGLIKKIKWHFAEDILQYNLLNNASKLTMPILMIVGENDMTTFPESQRILYSYLPSTKKELHIIKKSPHTFSGEKDLNRIEKIFFNWIKKLIKFKKVVSRSL